MNLSVKGKLSRKLSVESGTSKAGNEWKKQSFLLDTGAQYNPEICFQLFGEEKVKLIEEYELGDKVEVFFNISSREYNNRYYHNIDAWKINSIKEKNLQEQKGNDDIKSPEENLPF